MCSGAGEFGFELLVCRWAELAWHPTKGSRPALVARQLGTRDRRWDTVVIEVDPEAFAARLSLDDQGLDADLLRVIRHAPPDWSWYRDALPEPDFPWRYVRAAVHRAAARGLVDERKQDGRVELRRVHQYPEWADRLIVIENKPDLDASAARRLADQLEYDVDSGIADEVWVATGVTDDPVSPALLAEIPIDVGVLGVDTGGGIDANSATVEWHPGRLATDAPVKRRLELAERAYDSGWRSYRETMRPDCRHFRLSRSGRAVVPYCGAKDRQQTASECSGDCPQFSPEPPPWRTNGWPIEGGPGKGIDRLLERRRARARDALTRGQ